MILKPNMVLPGIQQAADATVTCLLRVVPVAVLRVAFLLEGQFSELASSCLNPMNVRSKLRRPCALSFSRAFQPRAFDICAREEANVAAAQEALYHRAMCNRAARRGMYDTSTERDR
jgi:fructose-bisphosphate aldolase class I